jgi:DNA-binding transcriptional LysR family regulator
MNWDDLRVAIAVHQAGSFAAAAEQLRIDETTVARRLARLQKDLGFQLFEAVDGIRRPTARGRELLNQAIRMAGVAGRIASLGEAEDAPQVTYRITMTDSVAVDLLSPHAVDFLAENPGVTLQFLPSTENVNFSRWEADIALRLHQPKKGDFIISKIADLTLYLLIPKEMQRGNVFLCAYPDELDSTPESQFLMASGLKQKARCITKNLLVVKKLLESRRCGGILPSFMCAGMLDGRYDVTRLPVPREVWLLLQPHLRDDPTARALIEWIKQCFARAETASGKLPSPP